MTESTNNQGPNRRDLIDAATAAEVASAKAKIAIPLNLNNWKHLNQSTQNALLWFHQHILDNGLSWSDAKAATGYDTTVIFKALKGAYPVDAKGGYTGIVQKIESYKRIVAERAAIQKNVFVENGISRMIFAGLNYALANNSITLIVGESRTGKTSASKAWADEINHGRVTFVTAPAYGGTRALLLELAKAVGASRSTASLVMHDQILKGFNENRILLIDEAHRLLQQGGRNATNLEIVRDIHDRTGAAVALIATQRFDTELRKGEYQFEQVLGRIGMPIRLPRKLQDKDVRPILAQYVPQPSTKLMETCLSVANEMGRLGVMVESLKVASRIASKAGETMSESHVFKSLALRKQMMGGDAYAA
ncbi:MAG: AAA family ATPase [Limisphaerales bacterium]